MLKDLLTQLVYKLCIWRKAEDDDSSFVADEEVKSPKGVNGLLDVETALLFEDSRVILMVDYDFSDVPSWIEGDTETKSISIVQMGGAVANVKMTLPEQEKERWQNLKRIALVSGTGSQKLMHYVSFTLHKAA